MDINTIIFKAEQYVKQQLGNDSSGHDWWHIDRVRKMAVKIAKKEGADEFICQIASLLHDIADEKLNSSKEEGLLKVQQWLEAHLSDVQTINEIVNIISTMSFNGGHNPPMETLEGQIVQDADRLDAIGAIGIARAFAYAGSRGQLIYDPDIKPRENMLEKEYRNSKGTAINHFYEKLLKLKDLMNTEEAKRIANQRHQFLERYLNQFYNEWDSKDEQFEED